MDRPTEDTLPYQGGRLVVASQCLATGDRHMWVVLAHYPDRGEWWATEGIYYLQLSHWQLRSRGNADDEPPCSTTLRRHIEELYDEVSR